MEDNKQNINPGDLKPGGENTPNNPRKGPKFNIYWIYGLIIVVILGAQFYSGNFSNSVTERSFHDFREYLVKDQVAKLVVINNEHVEVYLKPGSVPPPSPGKTAARTTGNENVPAFTFKIGTVDQFNKDLTDAQKNIPAICCIPSCKPFFCPLSSS
jgi:AFG3 family protein